MKHGLNRDTVTAPPKAFGATGRAKLLLSPISGPLPLSVFHPWPQSLRGVILYGAVPLLVAAEVTRRILPSNRIRLATSSATGFAAIPEFTLLAWGAGRVELAELVRPFLVRCVPFPLTLPLSRWEREQPVTVFPATVFAPIPESAVRTALTPALSPRRGRRTFLNPARSGS